MLKEVMKERGISQSKMARLADINNSQFNRAYNGHIPYFKGWKERIAKALELSEEELFPKEEEK